MSIPEPYRRRKNEVRSLSKDGGYVGQRYRMQSAQVAKRKLVHLGRVAGSTAAELIVIESTRRWHASAAPPAGRHAPSARGAQVFWVDRLAIG